MPMLKASKKKAETALVKRIKSLVWRSAMMALAMFVSALSEGVPALELSPLTTVFLGLMLGEVSKFLNTKTN